MSIIIVSGVTFRWSKESKSHSARKRMRTHIWSKSYLHDLPDAILLVSMSIARVVSRPYRFWILISRHSNDWIEVMAEVYIQLTWNKPTTTPVLRIQSSPSFRELQNRLSMTLDDSKLRRFDLTLADTNTIVLKMHKRHIKMIGPERQHIRLQCP